MRPVERLNSMTMAAPRALARVDSLHADAVNFPRAPAPSELPWRAAQSRLFLSYCNLIPRGMTVALDHLLGLPTASCLVTPASTPNDRVTNAFGVPDRRTLCWSSEQQRHSSARARKAAARQSDLQGLDAVHAVASRNSDPAKCLALTLAPYRVLDAELRRALLIKVEGVLDEPMLLG